MISMHTFIETKRFSKLVQEYGGLRVIYYLRSREGQIWMLTLYPRMWPRTLMARTKRNIGQEILEGLRQLKRGEHGRVVNVPSVASIREKTGLSQPKFAQLLGVSVRTLQEWEQGRRAPSGAARTLLLIAARNPSALSEVA
jgi:putative transcriptional regulator